MRWVAMVAAFSTSACSLLFMERTSGPYDPATEVVPPRCTSSHGYSRVDAVAAALFVLGGAASLVDGGSAAAMGGVDAGTGVVYLVSAAVGDGCECAQR